MFDEECVVCGKPHPRCNGHKKIRDDQGVVRDLRPCMVNPRKLEHVCRLHGGQLPSVKAKGDVARARVALEKDAQKFLISDGKEGVPDLLAAMEGLAAMALSMVEGAGARVNALTSIRYASDYSIEQLRAEVGLLERSMTQAGKLLDLVARHRPDGEAAAARNLLVSLREKLDESFPE
jgi:hypothetical protein